MGSAYIDTRWEFPGYIAPLIGFALFFYKPYFNWNLSWRLAFLIGVVGFTLGMFADRACRGSP